MNTASVVARARSLSTWEADESQGHLRIHSEFKASLDYMRSCLKKTLHCLTGSWIQILSIYGAGDGTRQCIAEVLEGRELEQDFERRAGLFVHCISLVHKL